MKKASGGRMLGLPKRLRIPVLTPRLWRRAICMRWSFESTGWSTAIAMVTVSDHLNVVWKMRISSTHSSQPPLIWPASTRRPFLSHILISSCLTHPLSSPSVPSSTHSPPLSPSSPSSLGPPRTTLNSLHYRNTKRLPCGDEHFSSRPISLSLCSLLA